MLNIAYLRGTANIIYPIVAGQIVAGCCRRADKKLRCEKIFEQIVLSMPAVMNFGGHPGFFSALAKKINEHSPIPISKILPYNTNHNPVEKFKDRAVAKIMERMSAYLLNERNPVCYGADICLENHIYPIFLTESFIKSQFISAEIFLNLF